MRRVTGNLLHLQVRLGGAGDLRKVGDGEDLRPLAQAPERVRDRVRGLAADAGVDLVEDDRRLARRGVRDRTESERDARKLSARGRLGRGSERQARVRADEEGDAVPAGGAQLALADLHPELAVAHAEPPSSSATASANGSDASARVRQRLPQLLGAGFGLGDRPLGLLQRVDAGLDLGQLGLCVGGPGEQLLCRGGAEAAAGLGDALELLLDGFQPAGLGLERRQEGAEGRGPLADTDLGLAEVGAHLAELRSERGHGLERVHGLRDALGGARSVRLLGVERLGGGGGGVCQLGHVAKAAALGHEPLLVARFHALCAGDELLELREALPAAGRVTGELVPEAARGDEVPPRPPELGAAAQLLLADEGVEHVELVRGAGEPALLELSGHGEQPLDEEARSSRGTARPHA